MRTDFDFTPYRRATVGFDRLFDMLESSGRQEASEAHPAYNVEKVDGDRYRICLAVPGYRSDEIEIVAEQNQLLIRSAKPEDSAAEGRYLHRGIATRPFESRFQLADYIKVGAASLENGLLTIELEREVPEETKPRKIEIGGASDEGGLLSKLKSKIKAA